MNRAAESSTLRQPLHPSWVAKIFQTMQGNYGTRFLNQWKTGQQFEAGPHKGEDVGIRNAMNFWGEKLSGFSEAPERIARALESLPNDPPNLPEFVDLCRAAPKKSLPAIERKLTNDELDHQREMAKRIGDVIGIGKMRDGIDSFWATHPRSPAQLRMIFDAAKNDARFRPCIEQMVSDGICTESGGMLKVYRDQQFFRV